MKEDLTINDLPNISEEERNWWNEHNDEYYHYFYRIDNIKNGKFYYGIHSQRKDSGKTPENDGYMGSGTILGRAKKKDGIENFKKTIIKTFSTRDEARLEEMKVVDEDLINNDNCYNISLGGGSVSVTTSGLVSVNYKDESIRCDRFFLIPKEEYYENKNIYITANSGKSLYKNRNNYDDTKLLDNNDTLVTSGQYISIHSGFSIYKNKLNNDIKFLTVNDPLVLSGEFIGVMSGVKQSKETILKKTGEKNGSYNTLWITNGNENRKINKTDPIPEGWKKGRTVVGYKKFKNINTGEEKTFQLNSVPDNYLPANFFNDRGDIITEKDIYEKYKELHNWDKVAKFFKRDQKTIKNILLYYNNK